LCVFFVFLSRSEKFSKHNYFFGFVLFGVFCFLGWFGLVCWLCSLSQIVEFEAL
jgi:hypothetical protein